MRQELLRRLNEPFATHENRPAGERLAQALGIDAPSILDLHAEVLKDLDPSGGVRWWKDQIDTRRSCLIGEHLVQSIWSVHTNLLEAALHVAEAEDWLEREAGSMLRSVTMGRDGRLVVGTPLPRTPADELPAPLSDLHVGGACRAIGSALDCLGSAIVGVLGLPIDILTASFGLVSRHLAGVRASPAPKTRIWTSFRGGMEAAIHDAGPVGWLDWVLAYRHMYVHRARRLLANSLKPVPTVLGPDGRPVIRTDLVRILPRDPSWSEAQAWRDPGRLACLREHANATLIGVRDSAAKALDGIASILVITWGQRREDPSLVVPPVEQWRNLELPKLGSFEGYQPGSEEFEPDLLAAAGDTIARLRSANVLDDHRGRRWGEP